MALIRFDFFSDVLKVDTAVQMIVPQKCERSPNVGLPPYKVLYLLHGLKQNETSYLRNSCIERYVQDTNLVVVMPSVGRSFYTDQKKGYPYFTYLTEELPHLLATLFSISTKREDTAIAGLSMGGYGALKAALTNPWQYGYAASMSGALDLVSLANRMQDEKLPFPAEFENTFGSLACLEGSGDDLFALARGMGAVQPRLYITCGTEDFLYEDNKRFVQTFSARLPITYDELSGSHTWAFWDAALTRVLSSLLQ
ncbi:MAG: esterase family protein [Spirochaetales bacterium]|nr:esterase family protein [Spirochaetales bacterium]